MYKMGGVLFVRYILPFSLRSALFLSDEFSSTLEWIIRTKLNISRVIHILDDFFFATSSPRSKCMTGLCQILHVFTHLNNPYSSWKNLPCMYKP